MAEIERVYDPAWDDQVPIARHGETALRMDMFPPDWATIIFPYDEERNFTAYLNTNAERYMTAARAARCFLEEKVGG